MKKDIIIKLGANAYEVFKKAKTIMDHKSDSVTIAMLSFFYLNNIDKINSKSSKQLMPLNYVTEPFSKGETVFLLDNNELKRGKISGFSGKGNIHLILNNGTILEHQPPEKVYHEWDIGYTVLKSSLSTETPK